MAVDDRLDDAAAIWRDDSADTTVLQNSQDGVPAVNFVPEQGVGL